MECEEVKKEYSFIKFLPCCETCHEDDAIGYGNDLWFEINGKERNVCCQINRTFEELKSK